MEKFEINNLPNRRNLLINPITGMKYQLLVAVLLAIFFSACQSEPTNLVTPTSSIQPTLSSTPTVLETAVSPQDFTQTELAAQIQESIVDIATSLQTPTISPDLQPNVTLAIELITMYKSLYDEVSPETIDSLSAYESELQQLETQFTDNSSANLVIAPPLEMQQQAEDWFSSVQTHIEAREKLYVNLPPQPGVVAYNRVEAFTQAHDFLDAMIAAFDDDKLSPNELGKIGQLAANAEATFYNTGDHQIFKFAEQIDALSRHAFRGEWPLAREGMVALTFSLPARPRP